MRAERIIQILTLSVLVVSICWAGWQLDQNASVLAEPQATITITQPDGVDDIVGEGDDFATTVLGDPWDMDKHTDIPALHGLPNGTVSGGILNYTVESNPSEVPLLFYGFVGAMDVGKLGVSYPIDTDHYHWLSFRIWQPAGEIQIRWHYAEAFDPYGITGYLSPSPTAGWHTYVVDLETISKGRGEWDGQVLGLYIISSAPQGTQVKIDWVRLTADNPIDNSLAIPWMNFSQPGSNVDFYLDSDATGCDGILIHTESNASVNGSFTWRQSSDGIASPANVAPGDYYVCAQVNGSFAGRSSGYLTVNQSPIASFTRPSWTSGDDYATDAGNAWDMSSSADIDHVVNGNYTIDNGILDVTVPASQSDVQVYLDVPTAIDSEHYYYLTYKLWFDYDYNWVDVGQVARVFWGRKPNIETQSSLIYDFRGWQTYSVDLRLADLSFGPTWGAGDWTMFRMDPIANNTGEIVEFYIDDIKLTGDEEADTFANVEWQLTDPDTLVTTMTLYYDNDQSGLNGTYITTLSLTDGEQVSTVAPTVQRFSSLHTTTELTETVYLPLVARNYVVPCSGACYTWYTSNVPSGTYYLYACVDDGYNYLCRYSEKLLHISHP